MRTETISIIFSLLICLIIGIHAQPLMVATSLTSGPNPAQSGSPITFDLAFSNSPNGTASTVGVIVYLDIDTNSNFVSFTVLTPAGTNATCNTISTPVVCTIPTLVLSPGGAGATIQFVLTAGAGAIGSQISTSIEIEAINGTIQGPAGPNARTVTTSIVATAGNVNLQVTMQQDSDNPLVIGSGGIIGTQIITISTVTNSGPNDATTVTCTVTVPAANAQVIASSTRGSCTHFSGSADYVCPLGTVVVGSALVNVTVLFGVSDTFPVGDVTTSVVCTADQTETNSADNSASVTTTIQAMSSSCSTLSSWIYYYLFF